MVFERRETSTTMVRMDDEGGTRGVAISAAPIDGDTRSLGRHDRAVLDALRATTRHPTAAQVYDEVRARYPRVGQATVYRALTRLLAAGLVVDVGRDALGRHYDARTDRHDHAICTACGRVFDLPAGTQGAEGGSLPTEVLAPLAEAARRAGVRPVSYEVRLYGLCAACDEQRALSDLSSDDNALPSTDMPDGIADGIASETREGGPADE